MKRHLKLAAAILILIGTIVAFIRYAGAHPEIIQQLIHLNPWLAGLLICFYIIWFLALVIILRVSLRMFDTIISKRENILLNAYSTLVNFFGPGQSGPAFRGLYLKKRHGLAVKKYIFATLLYYGFYALCSAALLFIGIQAWWVTLLALCVTGTVSWLVIRWYAQRSQLRAQSGIRPKLLALLAMATAFQVLIQASIFFLELRATDASISIPQALTYTGTANFALFASITPGAIGIREAFLVFTQNLHGISSAAIVGANVIDRAVYLLFLGVLSILAVTLHARRALGIKSTE